MAPYLIHADGRRLGKRPPKRDRRNLRLSDYASRALLAAPPPAIDHASRVPSWPMYGNDRYGSCGPAGAAHQTQSWSTYAERPLTPTEHEVLAAYFAITGGADTGVYLLDLMTYWRRTGIGGDRIEAFVEVAPALDQMRLSIQLFGSVGLGLALPDQHTFGPWDAVTGPPNPANGHYVCGVAYDDARRELVVVSWGEPMVMGYDFFRTYCDEAYAALNDLSLLAATQATPEGFDFAQLEADLAQLGDAVTPSDPPPPGPDAPGCLGRVFGQGLLW